MKAPDKICVAPHQIFDYDLDTQDVGHNEAEEYIRKDALLEWANGMKEGWGDVGQKGVILVLDELINRLNSL